MSDILFLLLLAIFIAVGAIANRVLKRPAINGASIFLVVAGGLIFVNFLIVSGAPRATPEAVGGALGEHMFSVLCGAYFAHRFAKRHRSVETEGVHCDRTPDDNEGIEQQSRNEAMSVDELPLLSDEELERQALAAISTQKKNS